MPKSLVDFFINSNYYKITQTTKYMYEALQKENILITIIIILWISKTGIIINF